MKETEPKDIFTPDEIDGPVLVCVSPRDAKLCAQTVRHGATLLLAASGWQRETEASSCPLEKAGVEAALGHGDTACVAALG